MLCARWNVSRGAWQGPASPYIDTSPSQLLSNFDGGAPAVEIDDWLVGASDAVGCVRLKDT